jgi:hypothetical protein
MLGPLISAENFIYYYEYQTVAVCVCVCVWTWWVLEDGR